MRNRTVTSTSRTKTRIGEETPPPAPRPEAERGSRRSFSPSPSRGGGRGEGLTNAPSAGAADRLRHRNRLDQAARPTQGPVDAERALGTALPGEGPRKLNDIA